MTCVCGLNVPHKPREYWRNYGRICDTCPGIAVNVPGYVPMDGGKGYLRQSLSAAIPIKSAPTN